MIAPARRSARDSLPVTFLQSILLGLLQGATEFLPVSSSGHLLLAPRLFGIRALFDGGWGLVRASNTQPVLVLRFEGRDETAVRRIRGVMEEAVERARTAVGA